jgi:predicted NACHT family NTPase
VRDQRRFGCSNSLAEDFDVAVDGERGVVIALRLGGERALPQHGSWLVLTPRRLCQHLLVTGATGAGKTETLLRLAWALAKSTDTPVFLSRWEGRPG